MCHSLMVSNWYVLRTKQSAKKKKQVKKLVHRFFLNFFVIFDNPWFQGMVFSEVSVLPPISDVMDSMRDYSTATLFVYTWQCVVNVTVPVVKCPHSERNKKLASPLIMFIPLWNLILIWQNAGTFLFFWSLFFLRVF